MVSFLTINLYMITELQCSVKMKASSKKSDQVEQVVTARESSAAYAGIDSNILIKQEIM